APAPHRVDHRFPGQTPPAGDVSSQGECGCGVTHVVRPELARFVPSWCRLRAQDFARHSARRPARGAADQVRPDCQPQDSESTWAHDPGIVPSARRRGDRMIANMRRREFITLLGGAATAWPLAARAQQPGKIARVGVLMGYAKGDPEAEGWVRGLIQGLHERRWTEGSNIRIDYRWPSENAGNMSSYAAELVDLKPDVIVAAATPALATIAKETPSIPIVFVNVADPVGQGFVPNFARPGGNITGFTSFEFSMGGKWVETIHEIRPSVTRAAVIFNPATAPYFPFFLHSIQTAASSFQIWIDVSPVHNTADVELTVRDLASDACLIVVPSTFMTTHRELVIGLAAKRNIPAIYGFGYYTRDGGLVSYRFDVRDIFMRAASYVDRILRGTHPADLPVQVPTTYELVINLKTAKALGLEVPPTLLARADEVIE